jgi:hypothetical protein
MECIDVWLDVIPAKAGIHAFPSTFARVLRASRYACEAEIFKFVNHSQKQDKFSALC